MNDDNFYGCLALAAILAFLVLGYKVVSWLAGLWSFLLGLLGVVLALGIVAVLAFVAYAVIAHMIEVFDRKQLVAARERESFLKSQEAVTFMEEHLAPCLVIDSNIWMNDDYDSFFTLVEDCLQARGGRLKLPGVQLDEITRIKTGSEYGTPRSRAARLAFSRIEHLQKKGLLEVDSISKDASCRAYADPEIIDILTRASSEGVECALVTDDVELRVRVRQHLGNHGKAAWKIMDTAKMLDLATAYGKHREGLGSQEGQHSGTTHAVLSETGDGETPEEQVTLSHDR